MHACLRCPPLGFSRILREADIAAEVHPFTIDVAARVPSLGPAGQPRESTPY